MIKQELSNKLKRGVSRNDGDVEKGGEPENGRASECHTSTYFDSAQ